MTCNHLLLNYWTVLAIFYSHVLVPVWKPLTYSVTMVYYICWLSMVHNETSSVLGFLYSKGWLLDLLQKLLTVSRVPSWVGSLSLPSSPFQRTILTSEMNIHTTKLVFIGSQDDWTLWDDWVLASDAWLQLETNCVNFFCND